MIFSNGFLESRKEKFLLIRQKKIPMEIKDFQSWDEEKKDINDNLVIPLYRRFCREYGVNFHFGDQKYALDENILSAIRLEEIPLFGQALSLFNYIKQPYHAYKEGLVTFNYTSWDSFDYRKMYMEDTAKMLSEKESETIKLETLFASCYVIALIATFVLTALIFSNLFLNVAIIFVVGAGPWLLCIIGGKIRLWRFNRKLNELKYQLKKISDEYENR